MTMLFPNDILVCSAPVACLQGAANKPMPLAPLLRGAQPLPMPTHTETGPPHGARFRGWSWIWTQQGTAARRAEQLRRMVGQYGQCGELASLHCPLPLDPGVLLTGIIAEECSVFKSALLPLRLTFRTAGVRLAAPPVEAGRLSCTLPQRC